MADRSNSKTPPGPVAHWLLGNAMAFRADPFGFMSDVCREYGDITLFRVLHYKLYMINHPEMVRQVMQERNKKYIKSSGYKPLKLMIGNGIFTSEGDFWLKQRRLYGPAFNKESIALYSHAVPDAADRMIDAWERREDPAAPLNISQEMMGVTLDVIGRTLFSTNVSKDSSTVWKSLTFALKYINHRTKRNPFNWPAGWPGKANREFKKAMADLNRVVYNIIRQRRTQGTANRDLLDMLMSAKSEETGQHMSDTQLRDEVMTIFLAGHETSANALSWNFYLLSQHPAVEARVIKEIDRQVGNRPPEMGDLYGLTYTTQVLKETMRLYPPVWLLGRESIAPDEIGGYAIPKGMHLRISPYTLHRNPAFWPDPDRFDPDRFSPEREKEQTAFSYLPFGGGPRLCVGRSFAMMEMVLITVKVLQRYRLRLKPGYRMEIGPFITLRPKEDLQMFAEPRLKP